MTIICAFLIEDRSLQASPLQTLTLSLPSITPWNWTPKYDNSWRGHQTKPIPPKTPQHRKWTY